jgi:molecular chaperone GrpE
MEVEKRTMTKKHAKEQPQAELEQAEATAGSEEIQATEQPVAQSELETLQNELEAAQAKANEYLDGWQRARAEFANYKKRVERDQAQVQQNAAISILRNYVEILDDLERALRNPPKDGEGAAWAAGIDLIYRKLIAGLESEGLKVMQVEGQFFDPTLHEAISSEESDQHESGQIIGTIRNGYVLGERVLRPALVRVAK